MAFKGITFAGQNVTPKNDGGLYQAHYGDGILWGCSMAISGDDLVIQSGEFIMGGRYVQVDGATPVDLSGRTLQTGYIQVIMNADLTQGEGLQWYPSFVESATTTFPALTKDDINDNGDLYQMQLAVVQISGGNLTSLHSSMGMSRVFSPSQNGAKVEMAIEDNYSNVQTSDADGVSFGGMVVSGDGNYTAVWNAGGQIDLRPNGNASTTGRVTLRNDGQLVGGHLYTAYDTSTTKSMSANTWDNVAHITGLEVNGIYDIDAYVIFQANSATETFKQIGVANVANALGTRREDIYGGSTEPRAFHFHCTQIAGQNDAYVNFYCGSVAGTRRDVYIRVTRIA